MVGERGGAGHSWLGHVWSVGTEILAEGRRLCVMSTLAPLRAPTRRASAWRRRILWESFLNFSMVLSHTTRLCSIRRPRGRWRVRWAFFCTAVWVGRWRVGGGAGEGGAPPAEPTLAMRGVITHGRCGGAGAASRAEAHALLLASRSSRQICGGDERRRARPRRRGGGGGSSSVPFFAVARCLGQCTPSPPSP